ncbi:nose resistant to fluoxetine protein 6-like [Saccoglossus kowalevskii]
MNIRVQLQILVWAVIFCTSAGLSRRISDEDIRDLELDYFVQSNAQSMQTILDHYNEVVIQYYYQDLANIATALANSDDFLNNINSNGTAYAKKTDTAEDDDDLLCLPTEFPYPDPITDICLDLPARNICVIVKIGFISIGPICIPLSTLLPLLLPNLLPLILPRLLPMLLPRDCPFDLPFPLSESIAGKMNPFEDLPFDLPIELPEIPDTVANISADCFFTEIKFLLDLVCTPRQFYAFEMFDAMGKLPSGLLKGDLRWLGSFLECREVLNVNASRLSSVDTFDGKYCLTKWTIASDDDDGVNLPLQIGVCMPSVCSDQDVSNMMELGIGLLFSDGLNLDWVYCNYDDPLDAGAITTLVIIFVIIALCIIGAIVDYFVKRRYEKLMPRPNQISTMDPSLSFHNYGNDIEMSDAVKDVGTDTSVDKQDENKKADVIHEKKIEAADDLTYVNVIEEYTTTEVEKTKKMARKLNPIRAFSGFINGSKLLSTEYNGGEKTISAIHGMRVLTLWWVIYQMAYETSYEVLQNPLDLLWIAERLFSQALGNGSFATDTFFVISGFLITYLALKEIDENGRVNWLKYYFHRVWRFWPAYIVILLQYMFLLPYMCGGPMQYIAKDYAEPCYSYWWTNVLFINNLYPYNDSLRSRCMPWTWYIACVMQFYIISPLIILVLKWRESIGLVVMGLLCAMDFTCTALISTYYGLTASPGQSRFNDKADDNPFGDYIVAKPHTRIATYILGMFLAYVLIKHEEGKFRINKPISITCWIISTFFGFAIVYCTYSSYHEPEWSQALTVFYLTVSRFTFGIAIAWVIFACATEHGGE